MPGYARPQVFTRSNAHNKHRQTLDKHNCEFPKKQKLSKQFKTWESGDLPQGFHQESGSMRLTPGERDSNKASSAAFSRAIQINPANNQLTSANDGNQEKRIETRIETKTNRWTRSEFKISTLLIPRQGVADCAGFQITHLTVFTKSLDVRSKHTTIINNIQNHPFRCTVKKDHESVHSTSFKLIQLPLITFVSNRT